MTWIKNLYETYENNRELIGEFEKKNNDQEFALIPISHTTQSAQIEVVLDMNGNFLTAKVVEKNDASTIIPCTEASANRTSAPVPHPLHDKLVYVAGDFVKYGGEAKKTNTYEDYMSQLKEWCESEYVHPKVLSVYSYLSKGRLVEDLVKEEIIRVDENNRFIEKWNKSLEEKLGENRGIFKVVSSNQSDAFVRFAVNKIGEPESRLWRDKFVHESFIKFYDSSLQEKDLCYITGDELPSTDRHSSRIRHSADMSKLISANDSAGFTYRGRFTTSKEAVSISYEVSQKAHNALKWLIAKQGYLLDGKVFLVWGPRQLELPNPLEGSDAFDLFSDLPVKSIGDVTHQEFANEVKKAIGGYRHNFHYDSNVIIMVVDAATPGRMAIVYYRDMDKHFFLDRIEEWHNSCHWLHQYKLDENKQRVSFIGAPATRDIAFAAYGLNANDKLVKGLLERMLPSIIDGRTIPKDIVRSAFYRASNPVGMEPWEWEKTLSITCALIKKEKEGFSVALDVNCDDRNYLFGRLLAIADVLESRALYYNGENRATNAIRYMHAFSQHPRRTWKIIQSNIAPYQVKYVNRLGYYRKLIDEVGAKIKPEHFSDEALDGLYLLGYYSQRFELNNNKNEKGEMNDDDTES